MSSLPRPALAVFRRHHGGTTLAALAWYAAYMRENATELQSGYDAIKDDPEARARQDECMVTTAGLAHSARACAEAADRADGTAAAYRALPDRASEDVLDEFDTRHGHVMTNALRVRAERNPDAEATFRAAQKAWEAWEELTDIEPDEDEPLDAGFQE